MGFWSWLLKIWAEPPLERRGTGKGRDRYRSGGTDRQFRGGVKEIGKQFRRAFGEHDQDEGEEE